MKGGILKLKHLVFRNLVRVSRLRLLYCCEKSTCREIKEISSSSNLIGVYAKVDWPSKPYDQWILAYNAMVLESEEQMSVWNANCPYNISKSDDERRECSKYSIQLCNGQNMDIPPEQDDVSLYASYGPKVNHQFYNYTVSAQFHVFPRLE